MKVGKEITNLLPTGYDILVVSEFTMVHQHEKMTQLLKK